MTTHGDRLARAVDAFNARDEDTYFGLYADDPVLHGFAPGVEDLASLKGFYHQLWAALPDARLTLHDVVVDGDLLATRFELSGTHDGGELMGVPASGNVITIVGQTMMRFEGDQIAERWQAGDDLGLMMQLGLVPAPA